MIKRSVRLWHAGPSRARERESGLRCNWVALLGCDWSPFVLFERMRVYVFVRIVCETSDGLEGGGGVEKELAGWEMLI